MKRTAAERKAAFSKRRKTTAQTVVLSTPYLRAAGAEHKFLDTTVAATTAAAAGTILSSSLNVIAQGNGESDRAGRRVTVKSVMMRACARLPSSASGGSTSDVVRVIVYQDKQTNGAAATVTDILESADYRAFNNLANKNRFVILKDKTMELNVGGGSATGTIVFAEYFKHFNAFKKVNIQIEYDNSVSTGAISSQRSNNIGVLAISRDGTATIEYTARIRYTDF